MLSTKNAKYNNLTKGIRLVGISSTNFNEFNEGTVTNRKQIQIIFLRLITYCSVIV